MCLLECQVIIVEKTKITTTKEHFRILDDYVFDPIVTEILIVFLTHSFPMHPFSTRWKHHLTVFWWFQGVEKGCIANKWVKFETGYYLYSFSNRILTRGTQSINYVPINSVHTWKNKSFFFALKRIASCICILNLKMEFLSSNLKACLRYFLSFHEIIVLQKLWKMLFISSKQLFSFSRYSIFCSFFHFFSVISRFKRANQSRIN